MIKLLKKISKSPFHGVATVELQFPKMFQVIIFYTF